MNQAEKRRQRLLEETRNLYSDKGPLPAVHPRYKAAYQKLYPDESEMKKGSFGIRCGICMIAFVLYIMMYTNENFNLKMNELQVKETIMQNYLSELY